MGLEAAGVVVAAVAAAAAVIVVLTLALGLLLRNINSLGRYRRV